MNLRTTSTSTAGLFREDHTALDPSHAGYDPNYAAKQEHAKQRGMPPPPPKWLMVDVQFERELRRPVTLAALREEAARTEASALKDMVLLRRSRLSVQPVSEEEWAHVMRLEQAAVSGRE